MHLLALGAFWLLLGLCRITAYHRLNAPFGARCFLTERTLRSTVIASGLATSTVLMHLLALGAF